MNLYLKDFPLLYAYLDLTIKQKDLSYSYLGYLFGYSKQYIYGVIHNKKYLTIDLYLKISKLCQLDFEETQYIFTKSINRKFNELSDIYLNINI